MNQVMLVGRLTKDPVVRYAKNDTPIASYVLAVDRDYKVEGQENTDFIRCVTFAKNAEFVEKYLQKGMKIGVVGSIQTGSYESETRGERVYTTDVVVNKHEFMESKKESDAREKEPTRKYKR